MSGRPKSFVFRPWVEPSLSKKTNGGILRLPSLSDGDEEERQTNIKLAGFFAVVALLSVLAEILGRVGDRTDANLDPDSTILVSLTLLSPKRSADRAGFSMRCRLTNSGNHSVFYPTGRTTSVPIGQLVARASPSSDWMSLSNASKQRVPAAQEFMDSNLRWIEMPPGGWADGEFSDPGDWAGDHAYAIFLKPGRNAGTVRILSEPYRSGRK
jgi:hypothetical protein